MTKLIHGEQYLELVKPIPSSATLTSVPKIIDVLDKGSGALLIIGIETFDENQSLVFYNQMSLFMVGSGNFGGKRMSNDTNIKPIVSAPNRQPDAIVSEKTSIDQAAIYRLCGDKNPLHIDPMFASAGGFSSPILHGLCTMGFAMRHVLREFAGYDVKNFRAIKARFVGPVTPGQTIETQMWREGNRIYFQSFIKETGKLIISGAYVDLIEVQVRNHNTENNFQNSKNDNDFILSSSLASNINDITIDELAKDCLKEDVIRYVCAPYGGNDGQSGGGD
ncbi:unnamed protein product, partial [Medioppia subpectinata]